MSLRKEMNSMNILTSRYSKSLPTNKNYVCFQKNLNFFKQLTLTEKLGRWYHSHRSPFLTSDSAPQLLVSYFGVVHLLQLMN